MSAKKRNHRKIMIAVSAVILIIFLTSSFAIIKRNTIAKNIIISRLASQGYKNARIQVVEITSHTAGIYGLQLNKNIKIGYLQIAYEISANLKNPFKLGNILLDKVTLIEESKSKSKSESESPTDLIETLKTVLSQNLPIQNVVIKSAKISPLPQHNFPFKHIRVKNVKIKINNPKHRADITGKLHIRGETGNIYTNFTANADADGNINFGYEIDKGEISIPNLKGKRLSGWGEFSYDDKKLSSQISLNIGSASILGVPFRGVTITYEDKNNKQPKQKNKMLIVSGHSLGDIVQFSLALTLSPTKQGQTTINGKLDITAKDLEKLPELIQQTTTDFPLEATLNTISGAADVSLNFKGQKSYDTLTKPFIGWTKFHGSLATSLMNLTLPPYLAQVNAKLQTTFNPTDNGLEISPKTLDINGLDHNETSYTLKLKPQKIPAHIILHKNWEDVLIKLPQLSISYGKLLRYTGSITTNIKTKPALQATITDIQGQADSPRYHATANIQNGKISIDNRATTFLTSNLEAVIDQRNSPLVPIYTKISLDYSKKDIATFSIMAHDQDDHASAKINGSLSTKDGKGFVNIRIPPVTFSASGTQPYHLVPSLKKQIKNTQGSISLETRITLPEQASTGMLLLKNLSTEYAGKPLKNINAAIKIQHLSPLKIKDQTIAIESFEPGIPFSDGIIKFSYDADLEKPLYIKNARWKMANGIISVSNLQLDPENPDTEFDLNISSLALQQLFTLAPLDGLEATGIAEGKLPVSIKNGVILIKNGTLSTITKGTLKYAPKDLPAFLQDSSNQNIVYLRQALSNFHYDNLSFTVNGTAGAEQEIKLHAEGRNPDFTEQRPIVLNLNLQGALENILKQQTKAYTIPKDIHEQIKSYEEKNAEKN